MLVFALELVAFSEQDPGQGLTARYGPSSVSEASKHGDTCHVDAQSCVWDRAGAI